MNAEVSVKTKLSSMIQSIATVLKKQYSASQKYFANFNRFKRHTTLPDTTYWKLYLYTIIKSHQDIINLPFHANVPSELIALSKNQPSAQSSKLYYEFLQLISQNA
mmetsp:Transcript_23139/g.20059  ORF Transcript_23139/g.20059 Transcript_23139/m.20059 type:complete len:106 (-) Transcript_23139:306-623(-)